jgi:hypothetical protein
MRLSTLIVLGCLCSLPAVAGLPDFRNGHRINKDHTRSEAGARKGVVQFYRSGGQSNPVSAIARRPRRLMRHTTSYRPEETGVQRGVVTFPYGRGHNPMRH